MYSEDKLYGLVLTGGKSRRMGKDKGQLQYYHVNHSTYLCNLLNRFCAATFISCRSEQKYSSVTETSTIFDEKRYSGPLNGLLSAHHQYPEKAWLVVAVDLPHINEKTIRTLIANRNPQKIATVYASHASHLPEPLVAIWEPKGLLLAEAFTRKTNKCCPRKFLMNQDIALVLPENDLELFNANFPKDYETAKRKIAQS